MKLPILQDLFLDACYVVVPFVKKYVFFVSQLHKAMNTPTHCSLLILLNSCCKQEKCSKRKVTEITTLLGTELCPPLSPQEETLTHNVIVLRDLCLREN